LLFLVDAVTRMTIEDLWYKHAVIYCLDVEKYMDADGDGVGDFEGLSRRLDYLHGIGVTCIWLQPFYTSPNRDNGYDVSDYYGLDHRHGSLGDYVEFMNKAQALGMRVIVDLVVSHTSKDHPWFQSARSDPKSPYRDWYVWSKERPHDHKEGVVFPGVQQTTWTWDDQAQAYYFHRFYDHQPDLDTHNRAVREEIYKIMGFWLQLGVSGFRMDAVPFLIERKGANVEPKKDFVLLRKMRNFLQWRTSDAIMLAEANVPPDESIKYFGDEGDHLQMMLNFPVNQRLFYALATCDLEPLKWALRETADMPPNAQWVNFLRSHDELDLGRLTKEQREKVFEAFAPEDHMQLYHRGIRRRLAPMLSNDRRRLELAFSLLYALPGTPMMQYGDEIGMGDDLTLEERECARTPMQWTDGKHGGFTRGDHPVSPPITDDTFGYRRVNVGDQKRDPNSLLNWTERMIRARQECPEIGWGKFDIVQTTAPEVLCLAYRWRGTSLVTLHNFASEPKQARFYLDGDGRQRLANIFHKEENKDDGTGTHQVQLEPYGYRWFRVGGPDRALEREPF
jgi:maltose alpha-D-glucosyltransferase / alpha-amylase